MHSGDIRQTRPTALRRRLPCSGSNAWAEVAGVFTLTTEAHLQHEKAKAELKSLVPEDAEHAIGHGVRAKRSKSGAISSDLATVEGSDHATV
jgi:hypothetical protein